VITSSSTLLFVPLVAVVLRLLYGFVLIAIVLLVIRRSLTVVTSLSTVLPRICVGSGMRIRW